MEDIGLSAAFVVTTVTVSSLSLFLSKILVGTTYDKRGLRFTLIMCQLCAMSAFVLKAILTNSGTGMVLAMNALGLCLGSFLGDLYYDLFGTYKPCFWFFTVLLAATMGGYMLVIRAVYKDREKETNPVLTD